MFIIPCIILFRTSRKFLQYVPNIMHYQDCQNNPGALEMDGNYIAMCDYSIAIAVL